MVVKVSPFCTMLAGIVIAGVGQTTVHAAPDNDMMARIEKLERENAAIRKENDELRNNKILRRENTALKSSTRLAPSMPSVLSSHGKRTDPMQSYAADAPILTKAPIVEQRGVLRVWGEGGAIWSGGDPISSAYQLSDFTGLAALGGGGAPGGPAGVFNLTPKVGWEAATGFDYRFANSLWHVSGQFRYGEGNASGSASTAGNVSPAIIALLGGVIPAGTVIGGSETIATNYKETHWIADLAVGREVIGGGPDAMQVKAGLRVSELVGTMGTSDVANRYDKFPAPFVILAGFPALTSFSTTISTQADMRNSFLGAGPRIGIEGSVPLAGKWAFDYLGDAAVLFGTRTVMNTQTSNSAVTPAVFSAAAGLVNFSSVTTSRQYASLFNTDIQVGISYWMTQNAKLSASYRLDAFINASNDAAASTTNSRYIHGPRVAISGQF
jgi:hypothetical protein